MELTIRPFRGDDADYEALVAIRTVIWPEYPFSIAEHRRWDAKREARLAFQRIVAEADGQPVGMAQYENVPWMYHPQKFFGNLFVHPEYRRGGIGTRLYNYLLADMAPREPLALRHIIRADYPEGLRFLGQRGFVEELRAWESRLDLASFDPTPFAGADERVAAQGITITTASDLLARDPDFWPRLYACDCDASRDVPMPEPYTAPPFEEWVKYFENNPSFLPEAYFVAVDGDRYVGTSALWRHEHFVDLDTGFTGVIREYRRRGIALAMKLRAIAYARGVGAPRIRTDNESTNRPMLSINEALGFVKQPPWITLVKKFDEGQIA
ncbi:MAG: GNAT family N-acetyltransferase [Chloroflexales bacterium]|nr:GNAT family N-acetyltransferase [Chloroflexales bacterium]